MTTADLIIRNATVYTMDEADTKASVIAVKDSRIIYVGNEDSDFLIGGNTKVIDANGKVVLPGLIDSHCHMLSMPALAAVMMSTSESPTYTVFSGEQPRRSITESTDSGDGLIGTPAFSP